MYSMPNLNQVVEMQIRSYKSRLDIRQETWSKYRKTHKEWDFRDSRVNRILVRGGGSFLKYSICLFSFKKKVDTNTTLQKACKNAKNKTVLLQQLLAFVYK